MKKLLLFALLTPLVMQSEVKAYVEAETLTLNQTFKNLICPWNEHANSLPLQGRTAKELSHINFNLKLDVITMGLGFISFLYGVGLEQPLKNSHPHAHKFFNMWMPRGLVIHEIYKRGTTLFLSNKRQDPISFFIAISKLGLCFFNDKLMSKETRNEWLGKVNCVA